MKVQAYGHLFLILVTALALVITCGRPLRSQPIPQQTRVSSAPQMPRAEQNQLRAARGKRTTGATGRDAAAARLHQLQILPASITLNGPRTSQRVIVEGEFADGHWEDLSSQAKLSCSNTQVAILDSQNALKPKRDGQASLEADFLGRRATAQVEVKNAAAPVVWSFRNQVLPVMTKVGCNSGACHGAAAGKNGFKLTLRGYDPDTDYYTLTRQALGRRTEILEPAKSLILLKPTMAVAHGGGQRFQAGSPEYQVISGWIAAGMPGPKPSDPRIESLEVLPRHASLRPAAQQQILVRARFSDGHVEDVTRWAKYASGDESVANVDQNGLVTMRGKGEAPVTVWYLNHVAYSTLTVPFPNKLDQAIFRDSPHHNYIDDLVLSKLQQLRIPASRPASDAEFLRRAFLDAAGILPTAAEAEQFLQDSSPDKRTRVIEGLLARSEFIDYWAYKWSDLLLVSSNKLSPPSMWSFYRWIRQSVANNKPWDQFVREIITASGTDTEEPAVNYFVIHRDPTDLAENAAQAFLSMSMKCAHCHNHPLEKWTQLDYYAMANLFSRVRVKDGGNGGNPRSFAVVSTSMGELYHPRLGRALPPRPPDGAALSFSSPEDRRVYFAEWLTSPKNVYFSRSVVNRVWKNFMGRGLVEPADDLRDTNPPSNEELLNALTDDFVKHGFDVRYLIRTIMESATYQTASETNALNASDDKYYSHYIIRRLPAEVLLDTLSEVTHDPEKFDGYPLGTRALQLPDTKVDSYFLSVFGRPPRVQTSESERQTDPSVTQVLHLINGETLNRKLHAPSGTVDMLLKLGLPEDRAVEYFFLSAFSRYPSGDERRVMLANLQKAQARQQAAWGPVEARRHVLEDVLWAMVTSKEFLFNQ
jgi:Protein of unknown function (DUF1553)/Protein of unknown function (DUF1549)/Bacterial Ig-like domain (group 2)